MNLSPHPPLPAGFKYKPELSRLVTASDLKDRPVYNWFYFPHSFSPELVNQIVSHWKEDERGPIESLLDPFVGAGTTLVASRELGLDAVGTDLSPLAIQISRAKLDNYDVQEVRSIVDQVITTARADQKRYKTTDKRLMKAFTKAEYTNLLRLRNAISIYGNPGILLLAFLNIIRRYSRAHADGGWFRWIEKPDSWRRIFEDFRALALSFILDLEKKANSDYGKQIALLSDARILSELDRSFDAVLTSPPYPNRHDYTRVFHLELLLGAGLSNDDILELRYNSLRSNVEAKNPEIILGSKYIESQMAKEILKEIEIASDDARTVKMLNGYLEDMHSTLSSLHKKLAPHGRVALVVSNVRHAGIMFPVDELLVEIAGQVGFEWDQTWVARYRGNSSQQMAKYGREPARESIVLLRKR